MVMTYPPHDPALARVMVDFDGVLAANTWPSPRLGKLDQNAYWLVRHYYSAGCEVVVFTARPDSHFPRIWEWLAKHGLADAVYDVTGRKMQACLYVDDRAVRWPL